MRSTRAVRRLIVVIVTVMASLLWRYATPARPTDAFVMRVVDGDTIQLLDGRLVRYIGMDAPEVRRRVGYQWVRDPEPWAEAATHANQHLVDGHRVRLEYDVQTHDRFGRVLAYVYVGEVMVNTELVHEGYARSLTIAPDVRYADRFRMLEEDAKHAHRGIWSEREK